jgi:hypothetical protein
VSAIGADKIAREIAPGVLLKHEVTDMCAVCSSHAPHYSAGTVYVNLASTPEFPLVSTQLCSVFRPTAYRLVRRIRTVERVRKVSVVISLSCEFVKVRHLSVEE